MSLIAQIHLSIFLCNVCCIHSFVFQVNSNGHLTFTGAFRSFSPRRFPYKGKDMIAPLWSDLDNRVNGDISYNQYTSGSVLKQATQDINQYFPGLDFSARMVFVATWYEVPFFRRSGTVSILLLLRCQALYYYYY